MASRSGTSEKNFKLLFRDLGIPSGEAMRIVMGFNLITWYCSLD
jgi:hypothetical protein